MAPASRASDITSSVPASVAVRGQHPRAPAGTEVLPGEVSHEPGLLDAYADELKLLGDVSLHANKGIPLLNMAQDVASYAMGPASPAKIDLAKELAGDEPAGLPGVGDVGDIADSASDLQKAVSKAEALGVLSKTGAKDVHLPLWRQLDAELNRPVPRPYIVQQTLDTITNRAWRTWLPETLKAYTKASSPYQVDVLMAAQVGCTNPDIFEDWSLFLACSSVFNGRAASFSWIDQPSFIEVAWTCTCLKKLNTKDNFRAGTLRFIRAVMEHDGLVFFPWTGGDGLLLKNHIVLAEQAAKHWPDVKGLKPSETIDDADALHVQLARLVNAQQYIRNLESDA